MIYKYSLEKTSKKYICPNCKGKRYVRYLNSETLEHLEYEYGRCDKETSCGYFKKPNGNLITPINVSQPFHKIPVSYIQKSIVVGSLKKYDDNNLFLYLINFFDRNQVEQTLIEYNVGTSKKWNGATVFWQVDLNQKYRTGKIMLYDGLNGKRVKKPYNHISWAHKALKIDDFNLKQCLFGLHLVNEKTKTIGLVESEKTALTMKLFLPEYTWIATGSKQNLKEEILIPIKDHEIILYPDKSEFNDWNEKCDALIQSGFNISCSSLIENLDLKQGSDLADMYFGLKNEDSNNIQLSPIEKIVQKLHSKNPEIKNLIETFNLTDEGGNTIRMDSFKNPFTTDKVI